MEPMKDYIEKRMTKEEEIELGVIIQENKDKTDSKSQRKFKRASEKLFKEYEGFAIAEAKKMYRQSNALHYDIHDLIQDALIGLWKAILIYDGKKNNTRCSTIAFFYIRKEMQKAISSSRKILLKSKEESMWANFLNTKKELELDHSLEGLSENEAFPIICEEAGIDEGEMIFLLDTINNNASLNAPVGPNTDMNLENVVSHEEDNSLEEALEEALEGLSEMEKEILLINYFDKNIKEQAIQEIIKKYDLKDKADFSRLHRNILKRVRSKNQTL